MKASYKMAFKLCFSIGDDLGRVHYSMAELLQGYMQTTKLADKAGTYGCLAPAKEAVIKV